MPKESVGDVLFGGYLSDHRDAAHILEDHYGLSKSDAETLGMTGDEACDSGFGGFPPSVLYQGSVVLFPNL